MMVFNGPPFDVTLAKDHKKIGSGLAIALSEQGLSTAIWHIDVYVYFETQGAFHLGAFDTTAVAGNANPGSRIVGFASCPGAKGWGIKIQCSNNVTDAQADCYIDSSDVAAGVFGVTKNAAP